MKDFIKNKLRSKLITEAIKKLEVSNIDNDKLYDNVIHQINMMLKDNTEISFGNAFPFEIIYDNKTKEVIGATFLDEGPVFSFHVYIKPKHRGNHEYLKNLLDGLMVKYNKMKSIRGGNYDMRVNVTNPKLADTLTKYYNFNVIGKEDNSVIMSI